MRRKRRYRHIEIPVNTSWGNWRLHAKRCVAASLIWLLVLCANQLTSPAVAAPAEMPTADYGDVISAFEGLSSLAGFGCGVVLETICDITNLEIPTPDENSVDIPTNDEGTPTGEDGSMDMVTGTIGDIIQFLGEYFFPTPASCGEFDFRWNPSIPYTKIPDKQGDFGCVAGRIEGMLEKLQDLFGTLQGKEEEEEEEDPTISSVGVATYYYGKIHRRDPEPYLVPMYIPPNIVGGYALDWNYQSQPYPILWCFGDGNFGISDNGATLPAARIDLFAEVVGDGITNPDELLSHPSFPPVQHFDKSSYNQERRPVITNRLGGQLANQIPTFSGQPLGDEAVPAFESTMITFWGLKIYWAFGAIIPVPPFLVPVSVSAQPIDLSKVPIPQCINHAVPVKQVQPVLVPEGLEIGGVKVPVLPPAR